MPKGIYLHKKGYKRSSFSKEWKERIAEALRGNKNRWKGEEAGYRPKHIWLNVHFGKPRLCQMCGKTDRKRYEWANVDGEYNRNPEDYLRLCRSCHIKFDKERGAWGYTRKMLREGRSETIISAPAIAG